MKRKAVQTVLASLLLGTVFEELFYGKAPGISVFLFTIATLLVTLYLAAYCRTKLSNTVLWLMPCTITFAALAFVRASPVLVFCNILATVYLLLLIAQLASGSDERLGDYTFIAYLLRVGELPLRSIRKLLNLGRAVLEDKTQLVSKKPATQPIIRGLLISLPLLAVFILLFASADAVFRHYIGSLFGFHLAPQLITRLLLVVIVATLFVGTYGLLFMRSEADELGVRAARKGIRLGTTEASIVLSSISLLFLIFVAIQIRYFFGGSSNITVAGLTYADYARRGFFELIVVAVLSLVVILRLNAATARQTVRQHQTFTWLSVVLIAEVLVIMVSAHRRLGLYEQAYGFTELRLYSHLFIGWLAVVFGLLTVHILRRQDENKLAFQVFLAVILSLLAVNILNPDAVIAHQNIHRYHATGKIDTPYLTSLSDDALPVVNSLLHDQNRAVQKTIANQLYAHEQASDNGHHSWQSFNLSRAHAQHIVARNH